MNRLASAQTQSTSGPNCWGLTFGYDAWGNLLSSTSSATGCSQPLPLNISVTGKNQISGYCYDFAGNLLDPGACPTTGSHVYVYNPENQLVSTAGISYLYDGDGKRVGKNIGTLYWYGMGSEPLAETDLSGNLKNEYVFFNGKRVARRDANNNVSYYFADHLGTARVVTNAAGTILDDFDFYPFGGERPMTSSSGNTYKFTGKERDSESGLDEFGARYYSSSTGRFMSPDWSAVPAPVPYGDFTNPQSLNLYGYVKNNPLSATDPDGHCCEDALQIGEQLWDEPSFLEKVIGGAIIVGAVVGTVLSNPDVREKVADVVERTAANNSTTPGPYVGPLQPLQKSDQQVNEEVKQEAGGKCEYCGTTTQDAQKSQKGVTPPSNEGQTDHYKPTSKAVAMTKIIRFIVVEDAIGPNRTLILRTPMTLQGNNGNLIV